MKNSSCLFIVEDNDDDYEACLTALMQGNPVAIPITRCVSGCEALDFLHARGRYAGTALQVPSLVLLDLNLPGCDGHDVLAEIKSASSLKQIPVVVMTSSQDSVDIDACYGAGANSYIVKPGNLDGFFKTIAMLKAYWFHTSHLPASMSRSA
ncbi:MAG: response regulator [Granulosicoccus sp.]